MTVIEAVRAYGRPIGSTPAATAVCAPADSVAGRVTVAANAPERSVVTLASTDGVE